MHVHTCGCDGEECRQLELVLFGSFRAFLIPRLGLKSIQKPKQVGTAEVWGSSLAVRVSLPLTFTCWTFHAGSSLGLSAREIQILNI